MTYVIYGALFLISYASIALMSGFFVNLSHPFSPNTITITLWLICWLSEKKYGRISALFLGVFLDLISYSLFGFWIVTMLLLSELIIFMRNRFFEVNSSPQAIVTLLLTTAFYGAVAYFRYGLSLNFGDAAIGVLATCLVGYLMYYLLATKTSLLSRWLGRKI